MPQQKPLDTIEESFNDYSYDVFCTSNNHSDDFPISEENDLSNNDSCYIEEVNNKSEL